MKTFIAVPCMDKVDALFAHSLATLEKDGDVACGFILNSLIYDSRNKLTAQALQSGADYILWFDSDMTFPHDTMKRLKKQLDDGADIATGLYFRRNVPYTPVLFSKLELGEEAQGCETYPDEPFEVAGCGFGCVMMKTSIVLPIVEKFTALFAPANGMGEDLSFCWRARQVGAKIVCDPSVKCGHISHNIVDESFYQHFTSFNADKA